jgi:phosphoserine phosphatase
LASVEDVAALASLPAPPDVARAAVFDADGTLWRGDIGDHAFEHAAEAGLITDETWAGPVAAWARRWDLDVPSSTSRKAEGVRRVLAAVQQGELSRTARARGLSEDAWREELYAMQAWIYAGHPRAAVAAFGEQLFEAGFSSSIFADMKRVVELLRAAGVEVLIASASHAALVVPGARLLGIPAANVMGMEPALDDDGRVRASLPVSTYGPHKAAVVHGRLGQRRPLLAFGDSVLFTDRELLASSHAPVAVATKGAHREAALADERIRLFDPAR